MAEDRTAFSDCLRLRELADRQTLTNNDRADLSAIADRLHALAVSRTDTRYKIERLKEDYLSLARWAREQNASNAFATQVAHYAEARISEWDPPLEEWEP